MKIERGGALHALSNYWIVRFNFEDSNERNLVPEYNIFDPLTENLVTWIESNQKVSRERAEALAVGFESGVSFAMKLAANPIAQADELRAILDYFFEPREGAA